MNYTKYLQTGGELGMPTSKYNLTNKDVDSLIGKILNGDKEAAAIFVDSAVNDPENAWVREAINGAMMAAEQGDQSAQQFLGVITPMLAEKGINLKQSPQLEKAGGNIPSGKAKQNGKYGCPCMLKKVGGKIIEVNSCDDSIAKAKNGMKLPKFKEPATTLMQKASDAQIRHGWNTGWMVANNMLVKYPDTGMYTDDSGRPLAVTGFRLGDNAIATTLKEDYDGEGLIAKGPDGEYRWKRTSEITILPDGTYAPKPSDVEAAVRRQEWQPYFYNNEPTTQSKTDNESTTQPEAKKEAPAVDNQLALKNWYNRYTTEQQRNIQLALQRAGYDIGKYGADGKIGNDTIKAIRKFQQDNKLLVDGKVGRDTLGKLWDIAYKGKSYATGAITPSAVNLDAPRQDIYNPATATAPYAQVNPIVAANKQGGIISYAQYLRK